MSTIGDDVSETNLTIAIFSPKNAITFDLTEIHR